MDEALRDKMLAGIVKKICSDDFVKLCTLIAEEHLTSARETLRKSILMPPDATLDQMAVQVVQWGRSLDQWRLENLSKWAEIIGTPLSADQPELLCVIDDELRGMKFIRANIDNKDLSDAQFREVMRRSFL